VRRFFFMTMLLVFLFPAWASAFRTGDSSVVLPIVGRFPGAGGTQWRTDVFISNPYSPTAAVTVTFYVAGGAPITRSFSIAPYSTISLPDIVQNNFGMSNSSGQLLLSCSTSIEARARIYNAGNPAGQFGQNVPGIGLSQLSRQAYVYGLSGLAGNRVNVGIANPNDVTVIVSMRIYDKNNNSTFHSEILTLQPHETRQFNDIFGTYGIPAQDGLQVQFNAGDILTPLYGYASEARNDTGDAIFVFGTGPNV